MTHIKELAAYSWYRAWLCSGEIFADDTPTDGLDEFEGEVQQHAFAALIFLTKGGKDNVDKAHFHLQRICADEEALEIYPVAVLDIAARHKFKVPFAECVKRKDATFYRLCKRRYWDDDYDEFEDREDEEEKVEEEEVKEEEKVEEEEEEIEEKDVAEPSDASQKREGDDLCTLKEKSKAADDHYNSEFFRSPKLANHNG